MVCDKCFDFLTRLVQTCEKNLAEKKTSDNMKEELKNEVIKKKRGRPKKNKKEVQPKKPKVINEETETERQKAFKKAVSDPVDLLTKCATCELSFLNGQNISCTEEKDPKKCGH
jgi:hypothetical protein